MQHRHLTSHDWSLMEIESLLERGRLEDWREFVACMGRDKSIAQRALQAKVSEDDRGGWELLKLVVARRFPDLVACRDDDSMRGRQEVCE